MLNIMEHQSETSTESCSLPPTPGKGVCDTDNDTEQYTGAQEDKLIEERSLAIGGGKSVGEPAKVQNEVPMLLLSHNGSLSREFLEDQGKDNNFTDLDLICCDGYMQVHRCVLMGASKFLRDLMIDKDILDTTAITLPDISIRHLRMVLGILYTGNTLIDECDEMEVFQVMNVLGLPAAGLLCRTAKVDDMEQVTVLRHVSIDMDNCGASCSSDLKETKKDQDVGEESQETKSENEEPATENEHGEGDVEWVRSDGHIQHISSTTCEAETHDGQTKKINGSGNVGAKEKNDIPLGTNKENAGLTNPEDTTEQNGSTKSHFSDLDDLNFEEACNSLQMQVAKPMSLIYTDQENDIVQTRKRKSDDDECGQDGTAIKSVKQPKTPKIAAKSGTKTGKRNTRSNVEKGDHESDGAGDTDSAYSGGRRSNGKPGEMRSTSSGKASSQPRKLSACTRNQSNGSMEPLSRVFLETKELKGVKYNIYGFTDPVKGIIQSGKTIAIMTSMDKNFNKK